MFSIFVTINIKTGHGEDFTQASLADAHDSIRNEPGCSRFDIHNDPVDPNRFYLYEVYQDAEAFKAPVQTPHFKKWFSTVEEMFDGAFERIDMETVFPSGEGWTNQQPELLKW